MPRVAWLIAIVLLLGGCTRAGWSTHANADDGGNAADLTPIATDFAGERPSIPGLKPDGGVADDAALASCSDQLQNGDETGIDCGGSCAIACLCSQQAQIPASECEALRAFYYATGGDNWTNRSGWNSSPTPCSWHGIVCAIGHVDWIDLTNNNLSGSLPDQLAALTKMSDLVLPQNRLTGGIPSALASLPIDRLQLNGNQLSGALPKWLDRLPLAVLELQNNSFSGAIPASLAKVPSLTVLHLQNNRLSGVIPDLSGLSQLQQLGLGNNTLDGPLPTGLGDLLKLVHLDVGDNALVGTVPSSVGALESLRYLNLQNNKLAGALPPELAKLRLQSAHFYGNGCFTASGELASWLTALDPNWSDGCGP
ncbi:MAG: leucine-rich repeat domain-containing protein [Deltaproteobacteria bacterium]|nr:leucine-rich repeat domain-containing protein [Deltaproteobacteria bacterium]